MGLFPRYFILGIRSVFLKYLFTASLSLLLHSPTLPSTSRETDLGLYANSEFPKGELWPSKATPGKEYVFLHFAGQPGPIFYYCIRRKLTFDPDLVKSYHNNVHTTFDNLSDHGGDGKQKLFCTLR